MNIVKFIPRLTQVAALIAPSTLLLASCATAPEPLSYFDFGTASKAADSSIACELPPINLPDISSPNALNSNLMLYRLLYANDQQSHSYANHRWSMSPAQLITLRIKSQLANNHVRLVDSGLSNPGGWQLRLDLTDFNQYFSDATHSYAQLQLRATILSANNLIAQTTLTQQASAAAPDAPAGAQAMRVATDALITDLTGWLCNQPHP
jgi:cholesterol transport system auxiliary component